jgi:hypothetical protein
MEIWPRGVDNRIQHVNLVHIPRTGIHRAIDEYVCRVQNIRFPTGHEAGEILDVFAYLTGMLRLYGRLELTVEFST